MTKTPETGPTSKPAKIKLNTGIVAGIVAISAVISLFYGVSHYKSSTDHVIQLTEGRSEQFEVVFNELLSARYRAMGIGADTLLQSRVTIEPFAKGDRTALGVRVDPYFTYVNKYHGVEQLNFWVAPATMLYRAGAPELNQFDGSKFRPSIVAAIERRDRVMTVETGKGGSVAIRAIVPVTWEDKFVGVVEYVSDFNIPLNGAARESHFKWALGVNKDRLKAVERSKNDDTDAIIGDDVFIEYSDKATQETVKSMAFDSRGKEYQIVEKGGHTYFVRTISVFNFSGNPTITIAMLDDISDAYAIAFKSSILRGLSVFAVLVIGLLFAYFKVDHFRAAIMGSIGAERRLLKERLAQGDSAIQKLGEMDIVKRQNFYNLMVGINEPLLAIIGQLSSVLTKIENGNATSDKAIQDRVRFIMSESKRLQDYVADFLQIELFRQGMVGIEQHKVSVKQLVDKTLESQNGFERLPMLHIHVDIPEELPLIQGNFALLERALMNLMRYALFTSGQGQLLIAAGYDSKGYVSIALTGDVFAGEMAPSVSLLAESNLFLSELSSGMKPNSRSQIFMGVFLAKIIIDYFGGHLVATTSGEPGFIVQLPEVI